MMVTTYAYAGPSGGSVEADEAAALEDPVDDCGGQVIIV
jgi:hypothetical protein